MTPEGWRTSPLADLTLFIKDGTHGTHKRVAAGVPLLSAKNIGADGRIRIGPGDSRIPQEEYAAIHRTWSFQKDDVLLSIVGTIGRTALLREPPHEAFAVQRSVAVLRSERTSLWPEFLLHALRSPGVQRDLAMRANTTAQAGLYLGQLERVVVPVPPLAEQKKIAAILSSVDDAIEATQAVVDQLDVVKRAMMAELLTRGIPGRHTTFKMTEIGEVPEEWSVVTLGSVSRQITDGEHQTPRRCSDGVLLLSARNVRDGALSLDRVDYIDEVEYERIARRCKPEPEDLLLSCSGTIGRVCRVPSDLRFGLVRSVALVKPDTATVAPSFLEHTLRSEVLQEQMRQSQKQAAQANLFQGPIRALRIPLPRREEQKRIADLLGSFDQRGAATEINLRALEEVRAALSTALLTGEIRVKADEDAGA